MCRSVKILADVFFASSMTFGQTFLIIVCFKGLIGYKNGKRKEKERKVS